MKAMWEHNIEHKTSKDARRGGGGKIYETINKVNTQETKPKNV